MFPGKIWKVAVALLLVSGLMSCDSTGDRQTTIYCMDKTIFPDREFCTVAFVQLLTSPEKFHGTDVDVFGYLVIEGNSVALFFRETSLELPLVEEAVYLEADQDSIENYHPNMKVRVFGEFTWNPSRKNPWSRTIKNIEQISGWL
jgi:hypothetical protein